MLMTRPAENQVVGGPWPQGVIERGHDIATSSRWTWGQHGDGGADSGSLSVSWGFICKDVNLVGNDSYFSVWCRKKFKVK